jgi:hypothetical protein
VSASLSHELNNVMAITGELSGLLGDLLQTAGGGAAADPRRLGEVGERITRQVRRGEELVRRLNRFAHLADQRSGIFDPRGPLELLGEVCQRPAGLSRVRLETDFPAAAPVLEGSAFGLLQAVHLCLDLAFREPGAEKRVTLACRGEEGGLRLTVDGCCPPGEEAAERLAFLALLLEEQGGRLEALPTPADPRFQLFFPRAPASGARGVDPAAG